MNRRAVGFAAAILVSTCVKRSSAAQDNQLFDEKLLGAFLLFGTGLGVVGVLYLVCYLFGGRSSTESRRQTPRVKL